MSATRIRRLMTTAIAALLLIPMLEGPVAAHGISQRWKYEKALFRHSWKKHPRLVRRHRAWHQNHPLYLDEDHRRFHHRRLAHAHRRRHALDVVTRQDGEASYYSGEMGACGEPLEGMYAAHKTWPCGSLVTVKRGDRWIHVRILDRGPYVSGRIIDLSRGAFDELGNLSQGVMDVRAILME